MSLDLLLTVSELILVPSHCSLVKSEKLLTQLRSVNGQLTTAIYCILVQLAKAGMEESEVSKLVSKLINAGQLFRLSWVNDVFLDALAVTITGLP